MKTLRSQAVLVEEDKPKTETESGAVSLLKTNCNCKNRPVHSWDDPLCKMFIPFVKEGSDGFKTDFTRQDMNIKQTTFTFTSHKEPIKREEEVLVRVWNRAIAKNPLPFHDMMDTGIFNLDQAKLIVKSLEEAGYWILEREF